MNFKIVEWQNNQVVMIDQRKLPTEEVYLTFKTHLEVADAIKTMVVRGAPAIGVAAAMGIALGALATHAKNRDEFLKKLDVICQEINVRPTAVNLGWALERMKKVAHAQKDLNLDQLKQRLVDEAKKIHDEDIAINRQMGKNGAILFDDGDTVLTHCNAGALATAGYGTALGVIYAAVEAGKKIKVFADETRPFLQGARLTAWELHKNGIPVTVITDNMAGWMMKKGEIKKVIVGADRIAANGDVANKIGTYSVAVLAQKHGIPFYVAAPLSTIDLKTPTGEQIPIEERPYEEVTHVGAKRLTPEGVAIRNPAFDVTPAELITAIITEKGIAKNPDTESIRKFFT